MQDAVPLALIYLAATGAVFLALWRWARWPAGASILPSLFWFPLVIGWLAFASASAFGKFLDRVENADRAQRRSGRGSGDGGPVFGDSGGDGGDCGDGGGGD